MLKEQGLSNPVQLSGCFGKQMYQNTRDAKRALKRIERKRKHGTTRSAPHLCVYRCAHCNGYHLGRDEKR